MVLTMRRFPLSVFNDYLEKYAEYPIIVTPREYTQEIVDLLADNDITHPILYSENTKIIDSFGLKFPIERFLKKYEKENKSVIYGQSFWDIYCMISWWNAAICVPWPLNLTGTGKSYSTLTGLTGTARP